MINEFITYLTDIRGLSKNTAKAYRKDITTFVRWMKQHDTNARWSSIERKDIDEYIHDLVSKGLKPATTNRHLSSIAAIYNYFIREGLLTKNPCKYESRRKLAQTLPNTIPTADLQAAYNQAHGVAKVMLGLLSTTGMRIQEMLDLTYEDINFEEQSIRVNGKGNKQRIVYTTPTALSTLDLVKKEYHKKGRIFTMPQREARYIIWENLKRVSNAKQLSPHAIRHTYATNLAKNGANVTSIAANLGHQNINTTQKYIDMTQHDRRAQAQQLSIIY